MEKIRKHPTYRQPATIAPKSVLTITSNVDTGKATGIFCTAAEKGRAFRSWLSMHGRDSHGWLASCLSVAKLPYKDSQDGIR